MKIKIHDLNEDPPRVYVAGRPEDCRDKIDRMVYELACKHLDTITIGKVIGEPLGVYVCSWCGNDCAGECDAGDNQPGPVKGAPCV